MNIDDAVSCVNQAIRDNLTGSGEIEELINILDNGMERDEKFLEQLVEETRMPIAQIQSVLQSALSRIKKSEGEFRSRRIPRRYR